MYPFVPDREPDILVRHSKNNIIMRRWHLTEVGAFPSVVLHHHVHWGEPEEVMHDHSWPNQSIILIGGYWEDTSDGTFWRKEGDIINREASDPHRTFLKDDLECWSLFIVGKKEREPLWYTKDGPMPLHRFLFLKNLIR